MEIEEKAEFSKEDEESHENHGESKGSVDNINKNCVESEAEARKASGKAAEKASEKAAEKASEKAVDSCLGGDSDLPPYLVTSQWRLAHLGSYWPTHLAASYWRHRRFATGFVQWICSMDLSWM